MIVDGFLDTFDDLKAHAMAVDYTGVTNPADGILYPDITADIPVEVVDEVQFRLNKVIGRPVTINTIFMRLTSSNTHGAPHQAHTDTIMGNYTMLLYLQDGPGGTSFVKHKETGMVTDPMTPYELEAWQRDTNIPEAWEITEMVEMKENRANIIPANLFHRAEPVGGFGDDVSNGRIVLTAFFE